MNLTKAFIISTVTAVILIGLMLQPVTSYAFIPASNNCVELNILDVMPISPDSVFARESLRKLIPNKKTSAGQNCIDSQSVTMMKPKEFNLLSNENVNRVLPTTMSPGTDQNLFYTQLQTGMQLKATQSITDLLLQSPVAKDTGVAKTVDTVQKATTQAVAIPTSGGISHKFTLNVKYETKSAYAAYSGYFNLTATYLQASNVVSTVLAKDLSKSTTLSLINTSPVGQFDQSAYLNLSHTF